MIAKSNKKELYQLLDQLESEDHFSELQSILINMLAIESGKVAKLSEAEKESIRVSREEFAQGKFKSWEDIKAKYSKWG